MLMLTSGEGSSVQVEPLWRIVYSSFRLEISDDELVAALLTFMRQNQSRRIGGVIWFGETRFFQILEGGSSVVKSVFERIRVDTRHERIAVHANHEILIRSFNGWDTSVFEGNESQAISELIRQWSPSRAP